MVPEGIFPSAKCCFHQSFARNEGAGVGAGVGLAVGAGVGRSVGFGVVGVGGHEGRSPKSQQLPVPHGATRSGFPVQVALQLLLRYLRRRGAVARRAGPQGTQGELAGTPAP